MLTFTPDTWILRSPSGGRAEILNPGHVKLDGAPLSYTAYDREVSLEPGWVRLVASCQTAGIHDPCTAATVMLSLLNAEGKPVRRQYADAAQGEACGSVRFERTLEVPQGVSRAVVTLALRYPRGGHAVFSAPSLTVAAALPKREANIAVTYFKPFEGGDFYRRIPALMERLAPEAPDLVVFSEALLTRSVGGHIRNQAQPLDGPILTLMSEMAAKHNTYIAANFVEDGGGVYFNSSALLDRAGSVVGVYRKVHLPLAEIENGTSGWHEYPVFATDFAKIGLTICWDAAFPEPARCLRLNGAELMINSTLGDFWPQDMARCMDNGLWFATAGAGAKPGNPPPSRIIDPRGNLLCACGGDEEDTFSVARIDFSQRYYQRWMSVGPCEGEPPSLMMVERRPETY